MPDRHSAVSFRAGQGLSEDIRQQLTSGLCICCKVRETALGSRRIRLRYAVMHGLMHGTGSRGLNGFNIRVVRYEVAYD